MRVDKWQLTSELTGVLVMGALWKTLGVCSRRSVVERFLCLTFITCKIHSSLLLSFAI